MLGATSAHTGGPWRCDADRRESPAAMNAGRCRPRYGGAEHRSRPWPHRGAGIGLGAKFGGPYPPPPITSAAHRTVGPWIGVVRNFRRRIQLHIAGRRTPRWYRHRSPNCPKPAYSSAGGVVIRGWCRRRRRQNRRRPSSRRPTGDPQCVPHRHALSRSCLLPAYCAFILNLLREITRKFNRFTSQRLTRRRIAPWFREASSVVRMPGRPTTAVYRVHDPHRGGNEAGVVVVAPLLLRHRSRA